MERRSTISVAVVLQITSSKVESGNKREDKTDYMFEGLRLVCEKMLTLNKEGKSTKASSSIAPTWTK